MAIKTTTQPEITLVGQDGNAFNLLGIAKRAASKHNRTADDDDKIDWDAIQTEAMSGDYDHLLQTLMKHFVVN